jgi:two-component system, NarL family, response regulator NreC
MDAYRIVLADEHILFRQGMKRIIDEMPEMKVVGEANNGQEAIEVVKKLLPDLAILDISMPKLSGIEACRQIRGLFPGVKILMLTMHKDREYFYQAISAGAQGYLLKEDSDEELFAAIGTIRKGAIYVTKALAGVVSIDISALFHGAIRQLPKSLTAREREVLKLICEGKSNSDVAEVLRISVRTVETHRANMMNRLDLRNTAELVRYAVQNGLD